MSRCRWNLPIIVLVAIVFFSLTIGSAAAQTPPPETPVAGEGVSQETPLPNWDSHRLIPNEQTTLTPGGELARYTTGDPGDDPALIALQSSGGPDDYGYTWNNGVPYTWIDATSGVHTGLSTDYWDTQVTAAIPLNFSFNFYGNTYTQIYISSAGAAGFDRDSLFEYSLGAIPSPDDPNNMIAPYKGHFRVNYSGSAGRVYYKTLGSAPNRSITIEWYKVQDALGGVFTFETTLYENGNIDFSYQSMVHGNYSYYCGWGAAIENADGSDGLWYRDSSYSCQNMSTETGRTARFTHPAPMARVSLLEPYRGSLIKSGASSRFDIVVKNNGDLGTDTYDIIPISPWTLHLFAQDGTTPLSDTDGDSNLDTGPVVQGGSVTFIVEIQSPGGLTLGNYGISNLWVYSSLDTGKVKTATMQMAVPAAFAQIYFDTNDGLHFQLLLNKTDAQAQKSPDNPNFGYEPHILELPNKNFFIAWVSNYCESTVCITRLQYSIVNAKGQTVKAPTTLLSYTGDNSMYQSVDFSAGVTPDGKIGIAWRLYQYSYINYSQNTNLFTRILDSEGNTLAGDINLTNNTAWGTDDTTPNFYAIHIAATTDNRFAIAWYRTQRLGTSYTNYISDVYYTVVNGNGSQQIGVTKLTNDVNGGTDSFYYPVVGTLSGNRIIVAWVSNTNGSQYKILDTAGQTVKNTTSPNISGYIEDITQLTNGNTILVYTTWNQPQRIGYAILDTSYTLLYGPSELSNPASRQGDEAPSVTADPNGNAVITWTGLYPSKHLFYSLVSQNGSVITPPQVIKDAAGEFGYINADYHGEGNTTYSWSAAAAPDMWINTPPITGGLPGGLGSVQVHFGNYGQSVGQSVVIRANIDPALTYVGSTLGIPSINGSEYSWTTADLSFLDQDIAVIDVSLPPGDPIGTLHPIQFTIECSGSDADLSNNQQDNNVMSSLQVYLPTIKR